MSLRLRQNDPWHCIIWWIFSGQQYTSGSFQSKSKRIWDGLSLIPFAWTYENNTSVCSKYSFSGLKKTWEVNLEALPDLVWNGPSFTVLVEIFTIFVFLPNLQLGTWKLEPRICQSDIFAKSAYIVMQEFKFSHIFQEL